MINCRFDQFGSENLLKSIKTQHFSKFFCLHLMFVEDASNIEMEKLFTANILKVQSQ